jgi:membrane protein YqaA with SNARE-associated domain
MQCGVARHAVHGFFHTIGIWVFHRGSLGLFIVGIIDSSFLTAPLANDLLIIALTASRPHRLPFYALMAAAGSVVGCVTVDVISRKAEAGLKQSFPSGRWRFIESQFQKHAAWAVVFASLMPPPFPFTPFVAAAAGTGYPRKKLLSIIGVSRLARFLAEGALAIFYGPGILSVARSPAAQYTVIALIVVAIGGSAFSIVGWVRKSRSVRRTGRQAKQAA